MVVHGADPGRPIVGPAGLKRCRVESVDLRAILGPQSDVKPTPYRLSVGFDEKRRSSTLAEPSSGSSELHQECHAERCKRSLVERFTSLVVSNGEPDVIDHPRYRVSCLLLHHLPPDRRPLTRTSG